MKDPYGLLGLEVKLYAPGNDLEMDSGWYISANWVGTGPCDDDQGPYPDAITALAELIKQVAAME